MAATQPTPHLPPHTQAQAAYTTPPNSQGQSQYGLAQQQQQQQRQYSPNPSHPQTPSSNSPSSPQPNLPSSEFLPLPLAKRHLHQSTEPGKVPYLPAALRPTEPPRSQPLTPPRSIHGSTDSLDKKGRFSRPVSRRSTTAESSYRYPRKVGDLLSHLPDSDIHIAITQTSDLPTVSGPPSRAGWKADANATVCDFAICQKQFGLWERRHHCRHCGNVFCNEHSSDRIPLDQNADYHPRGEWVRACEHCTKDWVRWVEERLKILKDGENPSDLRHANPVDVTGRGGGGGEAPSEAQKGSGLVAGSVGVSGDWSTF